MTIRINKRLEEYSSFDPTKESKPESIGNLCKQIDEGIIILPIFQTYLRWQLEKSVSLLNFQLYGKAAVSPISINKIVDTDLAVQQVTFIERTLVDPTTLIGKESVNDGQQRLSCNYKTYVNHEDFKCIVLDISKGKFIVNSGETRNSQVPVGILYNKDIEVYKSYLKENKHLQTFEISDLLQRVRNKHLGYYYTVNYARDLSESEQREWFEVLNLAGSRVTGVQISLTEMLVKGVDYYNEYSKPCFERLTDANLEHLFAQKTTEISTPLSMLNPAYEVFKKKEHSSNYSPIPSDVKASVICKLDSNEIRELFSISLTALNRAIDFLEDNSLGIPSRIDFITYLVGYFIFLENEELSQLQVSNLLNWYKNIEFDNLGNSQRRKIFDDLILTINN